MGVKRQKKAENARESGIEAGQEPEGKKTGKT